MGSFVLELGLIICAVLFAGFALGSLYRMLKSDDGPEEGGGHDEDVRSSHAPRENDTGREGM